MEAFLSSKKSQIIIHGLFLILCALLIVAATPFGLGVSPDSVMYLAAARSLRDGNGLQTLQWSGKFSFMGHFPPVFSLLLLVIPEIIQRNAVVMQILLLFFSSLVTYVLAKKVLKSEVLGRVAQILVVCSYPVLYVHTQVWSEPLMILGLLLIALLLVSYAERKETKTLVLLTVITMFLPLIRYASLFVIPLVWGYVFLINNEWNLFRFVPLLKAKKWKEIILAKSVAIGHIIVLLAPYVLWQKYVGTHQTTVRPFSWHPITQATASQGMNTIVGWFSPIYLGKLVTYGIALLLCAVALIIVINGVRSYFAQQKEKNYSLVIVGSIFALYLLFLVISISFFDSATPLDNRILAPVFPLFVVTLLAQLASVKNGIWSLFIKGVVLAFVLTTIYKVVTFVSKSIGVGQEYADKTWQSSETIEAVKRLDDSRFLISNSREGIYSISGKPAATLPRKIDSKGKISVTFSTEMKNLTATSSCVVFFKRTFWNSAKLPTEHDIQQLGIFNSVEKYADGTIYCTK
jgi:hypothetical protein